MKRVKVFLITAFVMGFVLVSGLAAQNSGTGWPSAAQLTQYGVSGLSQPAGTTGAGWRLQPDLYDYPVIYIWCSGAAAANTAAKNYFRGWTVTEDRSRGTNTDIDYQRDGSRVNYKYDGKEIMIFAGVFVSGTWPGDTVWRHFGLNGLSKPANAIIERIDDDSDSITVFFTTGGKAAYTNLRNQITSKGFQLTESEGEDTEDYQNETFYNERIKTAVYLYRDGETIKLNARVF